MSMPAALLCEAEITRLALGMAASLASVDFGRRDLNLMKLWG
jgi:hypothetical protein